MKCIITISVSKYKNSSEVIIINKSVFNHIIIFLEDTNVILRDVYTTGLV